MKETIVPLTDGPLQVDCRGVKIFDVDYVVPTEDTAYLCRCGKSKKKPFCDGAHNKSGFKSKREITEEVLQEYKGEEITVHFNRSICAGAAQCVQNLPDVFKEGDGSNWIFPQKGLKKAIIETINGCPSGALSYTVDNTTSIDKRDEKKISIVKNGPYIVEGIEFSTEPLPNNFSSTKYTLCRCGYSKNKPFCDYSHAEHYWDDTK